MADNPNALVTRYTLSRYRRKLFANLVSSLIQILKIVVAKYTALWVRKTVVVIRDKVRDNGTRWKKHLWLTANMRDNRKTEGLKLSISQTGHVNLLDNEKRD
jgi:hypothetical protein